MVDSVGMTLIVFLVGVLVGLWIAAWRVSRALGRRRR